MTEESSLAGSLGLRRLNEVAVVQAELLRISIRRGYRAWGDRHLSEIRIVNAYRLVLQPFLGRSPLGPSCADSRGGALGRGHFPASIRQLETASEVSMVAANVDVEVEQEQKGGCEGDGREREREEPRH